MSRLTLYALAALAVLAAGSLAYASREHRRAALAQADAEAARLDAAGVARARAETERQLRGEVDAARAEVRGFAEAFARAERAAGVRPVAVARGSTGPLPVEPPGGPIAPPAGASAAECVLRAGDRGAIDVASAELRTEAGNRVLVQAAEANRLDPDGSKHLLFGGELRADLTRYSSTEAGPGRRPGLGVGALAVCLTGRGCSYGPVVSAPPVLGRLEISGGAFAGAGGAGVEAQVVYRFR